MMELTADSLREQIIERRQPAIVEFWADWCVYSLLLQVKTRELSQRFHDQLLVGRLNVDQDLDFVRGLEIEYVPAIAFFHEGQIARKWYGDLPLREILNAIEPYHRSPG